MVDLEVAVRSESGKAVIDVGGEVDILTAPKLREQIHHAIDRGEKDLIVDLLDVSFMDSSGLGVLISALKRTKEVGGSLTVVAATRPVTNVLSLTGLDKVFPVHDSLDVALE